MILIDNPEVVDSVTGSPCRGRELEGGELGSDKNWQGKGTRRWRGFLKVIRVGRGRELADGENGQGKGTSRWQGF